MGGKSHVVGYTATKPWNKQLLNSDLPSSTHMSVSAGPAPASLLTNLVQTFAFCPSKSSLQFQLDVKLLLPILELLIIIVQC